MKIKKKCSFCGIKNTDPKCIAIVATEKVGICDSCIIQATQELFKLASVKDKK